MKHKELEEVIKVLKENARKAHELVTLMLLENEKTAFKDTIYSLRNDGRENLMNGIQQYENAMFIMQ